MQAKLERITDVADALGLTLDDMIAGRTHDSPFSDPGNVTIHQYNTGGKMGNGLVLHGQPGIGFFVAQTQTVTCCCKIVLVYSASFASFSCY